MDHLKAKIREVPDFPKPGILFYDITTLLCDPQGFRDTIDAMAAPYMGEDIDQVIGIESRGFILGAAVANALGCGFVPIRKPGKLPSKTHKENYNLEYGTDALEIHEDACATDKRILIVDDVLATGGTLLAAVRLCEDAGADVVGAAVVAEIAFLRARARWMRDAMLHAVLRFD